MPIDYTSIVTYQNVNRLIYRIFDIIYADIEISVAWKLFEASA